MDPSPFVNVCIDLSRIRANAAAIRAAAGVAVIAVVKSDAYGHGIERVTAALAEVVDEFCVFSLREAAEAQIWERTGKQTLVIGPPVPEADAGEYAARRVRPAVSTVADARRLAGAGAVLCVDTGMQRFACPAARLDEVIRAGEITEAYTHATSLEQARRFVELTDGHGLARRHAAGSSLLSEPAARLDAVRPGMAIYRGAARVTARLAEVRESSGPVGYSRWTSATGRHGVIVAGYSNGLQAGPCVVNGVRRRVPEVGMQSAFVEVGEGDRAGDEVVLLGDDLGADEVAKAWGTSPQEALLRLCSLGQRRYEG